MANLNENLEKDLQYRDNFPWEGYELYSFRSALDSITKLDSFFQSRKNFLIEFFDKNITRDLNINQNFFKLAKKVIKNTSAQFANAMNFITEASIEEKLQEMPENLAESIWNLSSRLSAQDKYFLASKASQLYQIT
jgi:hypothetical protein